VIVRVAAAGALARLGGPDAARRLGEAMHDPTERPRIRAIAASSVQS
jgi:HEAT repeat protein